MILRLALDLPEDGLYLHLTRAVGRAVLTSLETEEAVIDDVETVLTELYTNVLRHAQSQEGRFHISLEFHAKKVLVTVEDKGRGFSFKNVPLPGTVRADLDGGERIGGFGLELVAALSDRLEFQRADRHGMKIRAEKHLVYKTEEAGAQAEQMDHEAR